MGIRRGWAPLPRLAALSVGVSALCGAAEPVSGEPGQAARPAGRWTATWQSGLAQRMQLSLGGAFGQGPAQQNRLTATRSGVLRANDSLQFYGWTTTDLREGATDFETGVRYRAPLRKMAGGVWMAGGGLEHWNFPSVLGGTRDLTLDTYLGWHGGESFPVTFSANGKTLLVSDLPLGTFVCFQAQHLVKLFRAGGVDFRLSHGPAYVYSWDLYAAGGHRVLRYYGTVTAARGRWAVELMFRPQAGLQPAIPDNRFWGISLQRRFGR